MRLTRGTYWWGLAVLFIVNVLIAAPLFRVEYSAYRESNEGTFIAIVRMMSQHPFDWNWWPMWSGGMPFQNTYLPLTHWLMAAFSMTTGYSAARSFHIVMALSFIAGPLTLYWMATVLTHKIGASFSAALAYSTVSASTLLVPAIGLDTGGALNLRRLYVAGYYGEAAHTLALALLPVTIVYFYRAITTSDARWNIAAGVAASALALSSAFGGILLALALVCLLIVYRPKPLWKPVVTVATISITAYAWISPWLTPRLIQALRANAPTVDGDYRYTPVARLALAACVVLFGLLWIALERLRVAAHLRFFILFAFVPAAVTALWYIAKIALVPQPHRYHAEMDLLLPLAVIFALATWRIPPVATLAGILLCGVMAVHGMRFAHRVVRSDDVGKWVEYKIAKWMDEHRHGERAFISGSSSFLYNVFTDNPQSNGGHEPSLANPFVRIVNYTIYSGANAGARDAEYSIFWLKAFGARTISVSGPNGREFYKPFANPNKFDGVLPVIWQDGDDRIYEIPGSRWSLAHVMPPVALPARTPIHGLDTEPVRAYVNALDNPRYPPVGFAWESTSNARIRGRVEAGQIVSVQVTYDPGWQAMANGNTVSVRGDAIGQTVIEPGCAGECEILLRYAGGAQRTLTRCLSAGAMLFALGLLTRVSGSARRT